MIEGKYTVEQRKFENWSSTWAIMLKILKGSLQNSETMAIQLHTSEQDYSRPFLVWPEESGVQFIPNLSVVYSQSVWPNVVARGMHNIVGQDWASARAEHEQFHMHMAVTVIRT